MRTRICLYILLLTPLLVYWQTVFHDYGMRSDYSHLRAATAEPGRLVKFYASEGRPLYGAMLETSYAVTSEVSRLKWLRLCSLLLLTLLGLVLWRQLYQSGWNEVQSAGIGLGVLLLPSAQVLASWASGWAQALTLLLAMAGFSAVETEIERGGLKRFVALAGGAMIYAAASLIAPANVLFALVPLAGVLVVRTGREMMTDRSWVLLHLGVLVAGLLGGWIFSQGLLSSGDFLEAGRLLRLETNPFTKLGWFLANPLPNALALFALNDDFHARAIIYWGSVALVLAILYFAYRKVTAKGDEGVKRRWRYCLIALPLLVIGITVVAADRASTYRVLFAVCGLVLVLVAFAFRILVLGEKPRPWLHYPLLALIWGALAYAAHFNSFRLLAEPQGREWDIVRNEVLRANFNQKLRVHLITPGVEDRSTKRIYGDEFGSLSSSDPQVATEMFKAAVRERFGSRPPRESTYPITAGPTAPASGESDLVIDLRRLKSYRE
ncbi:hypothetical protein Verru16b_02893 [Lacunisphaera limnophila]|uniref:Glycosyltransferase RgtA/B/C/D-like domain-containing protein n=1 Tax=Lacunisphaera limnophila TaxID=1838286 RepID=A0A1D8AY56_9BACT|nr:hypothetical protein [Lacunisphaera limnophila]AOS45804.1 hypothetical protein Verru16b_02893 [Lacunisphaera limnophila]